MFQRKPYRLCHGWRSRCVMGGAVLGGLVVLVFFAGCAKEETPSAPNAPSAATEAPRFTQTDRDGKSNRSAAIPADGRAFWDLIYLQGGRVGQTHTRIGRVKQGGREVLELRQEMEITVDRFGQTATLGSELVSHETLEGRLIDFESIIKLGPTPQKTRGRVEGDRLIIETETQGAKASRSLDWGEENQGFYAVERSMRENPLQPGQRRRVMTLEPTMILPMVVELTAQDFENTPLLEGSEELLKIDMVTKMEPGMRLQGAVWADPDGEVRKTWMQTLDQTTYRVTQAEALAAKNGPTKKVDLGILSTVSIDRPIRQPHETRRIRYRITLEEGNPASVFTSGVNQTVRSLSPSTAEVIVRAIRPQTPKADLPTSGEGPTDDDLRPNPIIQSDDPKIVAMAREAVGETTDTWQQAVALSKYVGANIETVDFSQAFATASEVAESRRGDCTEHAVLLVALARAVGIPARTAIGLVYSGQLGGFGYHMWAELYVDDRWIPLDPLFGPEGIGAAHLKLAHSNLKEAMSETAFLPVLQVMGKLKIELLEQE